MAISITEADRIIYLTLQHINGTISAGGSHELNTWKNAKAENLLLFKELIDERNRSDAIAYMRQLDVESALDRVHLKIYPAIQTQRTSVLYYLRVVAATAAAVILICSIVFYNKQQNTTAMQYASTLSEVMPGGNKATLRLANGKVIQLNDQTNGAIASEAGITISKTADGQLVYEVAVEPSSNESSPTINTISTPRGGQYQVQLPDGSKVWLNAASSLRYAVALNERGERRVWLEGGEAYFEVSRDKSHPFIVETAGQEVRVLGTHFNINSYADEQGVRTTLMEGSVKVSSLRDPKQMQVLKPGEQSIYEDSHIAKQVINAELAVAWKDGKLKFYSADIRQIMRQVARWYDIDIQYKGEIPQDTFTGAINRQSNLSTVLKMFEASQIHFKLEEINGRNTLIIRQ